MRTARVLYVHHDRTWLVVSDYHVVYQSHVQFCYYGV